MVEPMEVDESSNLQLGDSLHTDMDNGDLAGYAENVLEHSVQIKNLTSMKPLLEKVCALLNSGGGILKIKITDLWNCQPTPLKMLDKFWNTLEEKLVVIIQPSEYGDIFDRKNDSGVVFLFIKAPDHLCSVDCNLYSALDGKTLPAKYKKVQQLLSESCVGSRSNSVPQVPLEKLPVYLRPQDFKCGKVLPFHESKNVQFKLSSSSNPFLYNHKQVHNFQKQISAFGNGGGGVILLGVKDSGEVLGQEMDEDGKTELEKKVTSIVNDMSSSWTFTSKRSIHWDMQFFLVEDTKSSYVIVISIAGMHNLGGIFTKCPESYKLKSPKHGGNLETQSIEFHEWRKRMLCETQGDSKGKKKNREKFRTLRTSNGPLLTVRGAVQDIRNAFFPMKRECPVSPDGFQATLPEEAQQVIKEIQSQCSSGRNRALLVASPSLRVNLAAGSANDGVICDLLLFSKSMESLHLFTLCADGETEEKSYAKETARAIKTALVTEGGCFLKFYITFQVVSCSGPAEEFHVQSSAGTTYPTDYQLQNPREKLSKILESLVICLAKKRSFISNKQGISFFSLLTKEQFQLLYEEIDFHRELWVQGAAGTGKTLVAMEFVKELLRRDPSLKRENILYVCENRGIREKVRKLVSCVCVCRKTFMGWQFPEVMHVILDEVQSFRAEDGDWLEKARMLVRQHSRHPKDSGCFSDSDDSEPGESSDSDAELDVKPNPDNCLDTQSDDNAGSSSDSESSHVPDAGFLASRLYGDGPGFLWLFIDGNQLNHLYPTGIPDIGHQSPYFRLSKVIRNTKSIFSFAKKYLKKTAINRCEMGHDYEGEDEIVKSYPRGQQIAALKKELNVLFNDGYSEGDIAILYGKENEIPPNLETELCLPLIANAEDNDSEYVVVSSFRMYSGLDRPVVILMNIKASVRASYKSLYKESMYCAVTRALVKVIVLEEEVARKRKHQD